eukprot:GHVR01013809.1.p1 GENE.GHVR01013809.1~~GHVR01013809.1.p1  ORF type:complete len:279 (+),score=37.33 GHVR01013809.1:310-1146(+)
MDKVVQSNLRQFHPKCLVYKCGLMDLWSFINDHGGEDSEFRNNFNIETGMSEFVIQIGMAITFLHDMEYIHTDIKLDNIILMEDEYKGIHAELIDFGLVVKKGSEEARSSFNGTHGYVPPEMYKGSGDISGIAPTNDSFAYGVLLLEVCFEEFQGGLLPEDDHHDHHDHFLNLLKKKAGDTSETPYEFLKARISKTLEELNNNDHHNRCTSIITNNLKFLITNLLSNKEKRFAMKDAVQYLIYAFTYKAFNTDNKQLFYKEILRFQQYIRDFNHKNAA